MFVNAIQIKLALLLSAMLSLGWIWYHEWHAAEMKRVQRISVQPRNAEERTVDRGATPSAADLKKAGRF